ncbi:hypothetical protein N9N91_01680 [Candidatus Poseidonia alphae]|nr:hypothetical protein [Candidatus Poseidonia alphae]
MQENSPHMRKGILCPTLMLIFMVTIPVVSADYTGEVEYSIGDSIFDMELTSDDSWTNNDASDLLCWIDENHGNNDGITSENEEENYEASAQEMVGTEVNHYLNGVAAILEEYTIDLSFEHGNCLDTELVTISYEGKFSFDTEPSDKYVLLFNTTDAAIVNNLQVNYCIFQEFEVQSVSGLADESTSEECVKGFRIAGEDMEIQFEVTKSEDKLIPAISFISTIFVVLLSLGIFAQRTDQTH